MLAPSDVKRATKALERCRAPYVCREGGEEWLVVLRKDRDPAKFEELQHVRGIRVHRWQPPTRKTDSESPVKALGEEEK